MADGQIAVPAGEDADIEPVYYVRFGHKATPCYDRFGGKKAIFSPLFVPLSERSRNTAILVGSNFPTASAVWSSFGFLDSSSAFDSPFI